MAEAEVISNCLVGATASAAVSRVDLTPWDLQFLKVGPIQKGILFYKSNPQQHQQCFDSNQLISHLKTTLSSTLDFFPPLAGRFATAPNDEDDETSVVYVDCNNAGVEFVHAEAMTVTVAMILDDDSDTLPRTLCSFFPLNGVLNCDGIFEPVPLMGVQITELLDGYFIACTLSHSLADGTSFWDFFNSWSELSRGFLRPTRTPSHERWFPEIITPRVSIRLMNLRSAPDIPKSPPLPLQEKVLHLSKEAIATLKEKANSETDSSISISSLQSYLALLWRSITRNRDLNSDEDVHLFIMFGLRPRIGLQEGYWGNAVYFKPVTAKAGELLGRGLGWAASQINELVREQNREEAMNHYMNWVKSPEIPQGTIKRPRADTIYISSSPRFDVYGCDFGWGKPVAVRSGGGNKADGKVTLFPGKEEGSVDVELCVHPKTLLGLGNDPEFMEFFSTKTMYK